MYGTFPHPSLTPLQAEALTLLAEEASEVAIECSKILRSGTEFKRRGRDVTNSTHLATEVIDFLVLFGICSKLGLIDQTLDKDAMLLGKAQRLKDWSNLGDVALEMVG